MRRRSFALLGLFFLMAGGCSSSSSGSINVTSTGNSSQSFGNGAPFVVAPGAAGALTAAPTTSSGNTTSLNVTATIDDSAIAQLLTTSDPNVFVVVGESLGTTNLRFTAGGDTPQVVVINVVAQTAP